MFSSAAPTVRSNDVAPVRAGGAPAPPVAKARVLAGARPSRLPLPPSPGRPLDRPLRNEMEARFGVELADVRIHTGPEAERSAADLRARAFTVGPDIAFGPGEYAPSTVRGKKLLAHELAHVVQQTERSTGVDAPEPALEQDARQAAEAVARSGEIRVGERTAPRVSRQETQEEPDENVSLVEISCAINEIRFHTKRRIVAYKLTECDLSEGAFYDSKVIVDRAKRVVRFELGDNAPEGVRFRFNYLVGPGQPAPIELFRDQKTVDIMATNLPPRDVQAAKAAAAAATAVPDLEANVLHMSREMAMDLCQKDVIHPLTFPFRGTRFGGAPIDAWRDGPYIRVKQPTYVHSNSDFRRQTRTLPTDTFISGVRLHPGEVVRVHIYEPPWYKLNIFGDTSGDRESEFCLMAEDMLKVADASRKGTLLNIALTGVEALTFMVPVGKLAAPVMRAGRTGLAAAMIGTAEVAPTAFANVASRTAVTAVESRVETQVVEQAIERSVASSVTQSAAQTAERTVAESAVPRVAGASLGAPAATGVAVTGADVGGGQIVQNLARSPIQGATEVQLSRAEYEAALRLVFPSQFAEEISVLADGIGNRAAQRAVADPRFIAAVQNGNMTLAGTLFHSAAAQEARALPAAAIPGGWVLEAERVIQAGAGGSRADILLRGPAGQVIEFDWKTTGGSALSYGSRQEMLRHAGQITTNIGGTLVRQESRSWVDYVRPLLPGVF